MPLIITKKDITSLSVDAIVNAANRELKTMLSAAAVVYAERFSERQAMKKCRLPVTKLASAKLVVLWLPVDLLCLPNM